MNEATRDIVIRALQDKLGAANDNLYRALRTAKAIDASKMYGQSGQTLNQIIAGYQEEANVYAAAIQELAIATPSPTETKP